MTTVTIAVCAYNEEQNITAFLRSILAQQEDGFTISQIIVVSDGSDDGTVAAVQSIEDSRIKLVQGKERIGKSSRLNDIYAHLKTDILVQSDADVVFAHPSVVRDIIAPLQKHHQIGMCGGNPTPLPAQTFIERAVNSTVSAYLELRKTVREGNNVFSADGRLLAFRRELVQTAHIPITMIANDMYMYFYCLSQGFQYAHVPTAIVHFRSPQTVQDQVKQNTRFIAGPTRMTRYFSSELVQTETAIPIHLRLSAIIQPIIRNPLGCLIIFGINRYCHLRALFLESRLTARWQLATSTKQVISRNHLQNDDPSDTIPMLFNVFPTVYYVQMEIFHV